LNPLSYLYTFRIPIPSICITYVSESKFRRPLGSFRKSFATIAGLAKSRMVEKENKRSWLKIVHPFLPTTMSRRPSVLVFWTIEISESAMSISSVWTPVACLQGGKNRSVSSHGIWLDNLGSYNLSTIFSSELGDFKDRAKSSILMSSNFCLSWNDAIKDDQLQVLEAQNLFRKEQAVLKRNRILGNTPSGLASCKETFMTWSGFPSSSGLILLHWVFCSRTLDSVAIWRIFVVCFTTGND
jgi:hypothetical protein